MINLSKIKKVAYPKEHGSWGFYFEPLLLSIIVAYSKNGLFLFLVSLFIFFAHQPVRVLFNKNQTEQLKKIALIFLMIYSGLAILFMTLIPFNFKIYVFIPFFLAIIIMAFYLAAEVLNYKKTLTTEAIAPFAVDLIAVSIVLLGGWTFASAMAFLVVLLNRSFPTVLYIHERLKLEREKEILSGFVNVFGMFGLLITIFLSFEKLIPYLSILAVLILVVRSSIGLSKFRKKLNIKQIGIYEFIYGILFVAIVALGYIINF